MPKLTELSTNHLLWMYRELKNYGGERDKPELEAVTAELEARDERRNRQSV